MAATGRSDGEPRIVWKETSGGVEVLRLIVHEVVLPSREPADVAVRPARVSADADPHSLPSA